MGALKGSITYVRFFVNEPLADADRQKAMARIRTRAFKPLEPEDEDEVSVGWVPTEAPFDEEPSFGVHNVFPGDDKYLIISLRMDRWQFPVTLIRSKLAVAEKAYLEKKKRDRISRAERAELRDVVIRRLRREGVPVTKVADAVWNIETGELRLFNRGRTITEYFVELFEKTFGKDLSCDSPFMTFKNLGMPRVPPTSVPHVIAKTVPFLEPIDFHIASKLVPPACVGEIPLAEANEKTRFLGREFLTWFWFHVEAMEKSDLGPAWEKFSGVWFERSFVLQNMGEQVERVSTSAMDPSETPEAKKALQQGKLLTRATIAFDLVDPKGPKDQEPRSFRLTIDSDTFSISAMKIPALLTGEGDDPFVERMTLIETAQRTIDDLYFAFLVERVSPAFYKSAVPAIRRWMYEEEEG